MNLFETNGLATTPGSVAITVTAPAGYTLAFAPSITSINVSGGGATAVSNANWSVTNIVGNIQISLIMKTGQFIGANSTNSLGFSITRTSASSGSTANINVNVTNDATNGYDSNLTNNVYARIISGL
ncbi:hypothetical protein GO730_06080 [Spirosoma sp. HMF3257]|uniref:hypothetical protein n=1 Tax=Spirosoma telluris TaxID=2183553 RepID=UPI0011B94A1B|nr:hypothetical protein [Spirosoma telluris]